MNRLTLSRILESLALALLVSGAVFGFALSWNAQQGVPALWTATAITFLGAAVGRIVTGLLRDAGERPAGAPRASQMGLSIAALIIVVGCVPVFVLAKGDVGQFTLWLGIHLFAQLALAGFHHWRSQRRDAEAGYGGL